MSTKKSTTVTVGVAPISPLVESEGDTYNGFEIAIWEYIAGELNIEYQYKEYSFLKLLDAVEKGDVDVGIGAISITEEREKRFDFSHTTMRSGLAVLAPPDTSSGVFSVLKEFIAKRYKESLSVLGFLTALLAAIAHIVWFIERGKGIFGTSYSEGIFEALWWTIVTVSTVGYGDLVPATVLGKLFGMLIILFGVAIFGTLIAHLTTLLTMKRITLDIGSYRDLRGKKVAAQKGTTAVVALRETGARAVEVSNIAEGVSLLKKKRVAAVVHDTPVVQYYLNVNKIDPEEFVIKDIFDHQYYGLALPGKNNKLRNSINEVILKQRESGAYSQLHLKWFGSKADTSE